jgi:DNA polymerase-3 subunit beta
VDGVFPDYRQIMPKSSSTEVVLSKEDFVSALRLANIFSDRLNRINFKVIPQENFVEISAQNTDVGENTIKLSPQMVQGEEIEINYNVKYILDCLSFITSQDISLKFMGKNRPMLLSPVGDNSFNYLVMPLNR